MMTNKELAAKLINVAKNYKTLYVMGCFGAPMTASNKKRYTQNHSYNRQPERTAMINAASADTFGFDCVCLIKGLLWGWNGNKNAVYGGATYTSNGVPDIGADQMIKVCKNVTTDFSKIEVGEAVWLEGHIGVYVGDGLAVECTPRWANKVQLTACNRNVSGYNRRNWTKHGKLPYVEYVADATTPPVETTEIRGIDVSKWQGEIDWKKVKAAGIKFAMIRLGYGSSKGDACGLDGYFEKNVKNAIAAGIDIGCYFYSYATSVAAAKKEAAYVINVLQKYKGVFTYPVAFDLEDKTQQGLGKQVLTDMVIAFGDAIEKAGFYCSLYSNPSWMKSYLDADRVKRFDLWLAHWTDKTNYAGAYGMWQNSSSGKVNGINGNVDTDFAYKDYPTIIKGKKLNGFTGSGQQPTVPDQPDPEPETTLKVGDLVKITGSKYYGGQNIPSWVKAKNWYVRQINGDRVVIDKSEDGQNAICSPVHASGLQLVRRGTDAGTAQIYTVVKGDTLWGIAKKLLGSGYRYTEIVKLNGLKSSVIYSGQKLKIPQK
ncbi:MAG: GH25 family lysozyme [Christensenellales bacterium]|jgi:GH25 family lysozyme M1 (1,4-beta-N-acetylmuramidase)